MKKIEFLLRPVSLLFFFLSLSIAFGFYPGPMPTLFFLAVSLGISFFQKKFWPPIHVFLLFPLTLVETLGLFDLEQKIVILFSVFFAVSVARLMIPVLQREVEEKVALLLIFILMSAVIVHFSVQELNFTGDEPHYLIITESIVRDLDLNVANNYHDESYRKFLDTSLRIHGFFGIKGTSHIYSIHSPGTSFLIAPFYLVAEIFQKKIFYLVFVRMGILMFALLALHQLYLLLMDMGFSRRISIWGMILFAFFSPFVFYSYHLYPEIFGMLFSIGLVRALFFRRARIFLILTPLVLPWIGVKYNILLATIYLIFIAKNLNLKKIVRIFPSFLTYAFSLCLFFYYTYFAFGNLNPSSFYRGIQTKAQAKSFFKLVLYEIPLWSRIDTFLDYFLDQRDGLFTYFPFLILIIPAFFMFIKGMKKFSFLLFVPSLFVFSYAWQTHRGGYCPPARPLMSTIWVAAPLIAFFIQNRKEKLLVFFAGLNAFFLSVIFFNPKAIYNSTTHEVTERASGVTEFLSNAVLNWKDLFPSYIKQPNFDHYANYIWIAGIILLTYLILKDFRLKLPRWMGRVIALALLLVVILPSQLRLGDLKKLQVRQKWGHFNVVKLSNNGSFRSNQVVIARKGDYDFLITAKEYFREVFLEFSEDQEKMTFRNFWLLPSRTSKYKNAYVHPVCFKVGQLRKDEEILLELKIR